MHGGGEEEADRFVDVGFRDEGGEGEFGEGFGDAGDLMGVDAVISMGENEKRGRGRSRGKGKSRSEGVLEDLRLQVAGW